MLEKQLRVNQYRIVVGKLAGLDDGIAFLLVSALAKSLAVAVEAVPIGVLFVSVSPFQSQIVSTDDRARDEMRGQEQE
jgi:hypothetical protein